MLLACLPAVLLCLPFLVTHWLPGIIYFSPLVVILLALATLVLYTMRYSEVLLPWNWLQYIHLEVCSKEESRSNADYAAEDDFVSALEKDAELAIKRIEANDLHNKGEKNLALLPRRNATRSDLDVPGDKKLPLAWGANETPAVEETERVRASQNLGVRMESFLKDEENNEDALQAAQHALDEAAKLRNRNPDTVAVILTIRAVLYFWFFRAVGGIVIQILLQVPMNYLIMIYDSPETYANGAGYGSVMSDEFEMRSITCFLLSTVLGVSEAFSAVLYLF